MPIVWLHFSDGCLLVFLLFAEVPKESIMELLLCVFHICGDPVEWAAGRGPGKLAKDSTAVSKRNEKLLGYDDCVRPLKHEK